MRVFFDEGVGTSPEEAHDEEWQNIPQGQCFQHFFLMLINLDDMMRDIVNHKINFLIIAILSVIYLQIVMRVMMLHQCQLFDLLIWVFSVGFLEGYAGDDPKDSHDGKNDHG